MKPSKEMKFDMPAIISGVLYGISMFIAGFAMGAVRILYLEPRIGEVNSLLVEIPIMLPICWLLSKQALLSWYFLNIVLIWGDKIRKTNVDIIGVASFLTLVFLEVALSMTLFHHTFDETREELATRIGTAGLAIQLLACSFPIFQEAMQEREMHAHVKV